MSDPFDKSYFDEAYPGAIRFAHAEKGMTRFPPNVDQISVKCEPRAAVLTVRRNDTRIEFRLLAGDCRHLAKLLMDASARVPADGGAVADCPTGDDEEQ